MDQVTIQTADTIDIAKGGVIHTLLYFDIFQYPLTLDELFRYNPFPLGQSDLKMAIENLQDELVIHKHDCFYSLHPEESVIQKRKEGNELAKKRLRTAQRYSRLIASFPFVRSIMLSGSLSKDYMDSKSDIDYFIITQPGRLWLTRGMLALFKRVFLFNSHKNFCTNYLIDTESLEIEEKNFYTAIETKTLIPVYGKDLYEKFAVKNRWTKNHLPNFSSQKTAFIAEKGNPIKKILEYIFSGKLGEKLDILCLHLGLKRWRKNYGHLFTEEEFNLAFKSARNVSKNHPRFFQKQVLMTFEKRIRNFENKHNIKLSA